MSSTPPATSHKSRTARRLSELVSRFFHDPEVIAEIVEEAGRLEAAGGTGRLLVTVDIKDASAAMFQAVAVPSTRSIAHRQRRTLVLEELAGSALLAVGLKGGAR